MTWNVFLRRKKKVNGEEEREIRSSFWLIKIWKRANCRIQERKKARRFINYVLGMNDDLWDRVREALQTQINSTLFVLDFNTSNSRIDSFILKAVQTTAIRSFLKNEIWNTSKFRFCIPCRTADCYKNQTSRNQIWGQTDRWRGENTLRINMPQNAASIQQVVTLFPLLYIYCISNVTKWLLVTKCKRVAYTQPYVA